MFIAIYLVQRACVCMSCSLHCRYKSTETRGVKIRFPQTSRDVEMIHCTSETMGSCMEKPNGTKSRNKVYLWHCSNPGEDSLASRHTLDTLSPSLHLATFCCCTAFMASTIYWNMLGITHYKNCPHTHAQKIDLNSMWPVAKCIPYTKHTYKYSLHWLSKR